MEIGKFINGMLLVGLVASLMTLFFAGLYNHYGDSVTDYDDTAYNYKKTDEINLNLNSTKTQIDKITSEESSLYDKLSGFIGGTVGALKTLTQTIDLSFGLIDSGIEDSKMGASGILLKSALASMVLLGLILLVIKAYLKLQDL